MAKQIGARKDGSYELMCAFPSIEYNVAWIPTPFPVKYDLGSAQNVSSNVKYNGKCAYIEGCDTKKVEGDELGTNKGLVVKESTTAATTFCKCYSPTVKVNGKHAHRCGDKQWMVPAFPVR